GGGAKGRAGGGGWGPTGTAGSVSHLSSGVLSALTYPSHGRQPHPGNQPQEDSMSTTKNTRAAARSTESAKSAKGFTAEERAAVRARAQELKSESGEGHAGRRVAEEAAADREGAGGVEAPS